MSEQSQEQQRRTGLAFVAPTTDEPVLIRRLSLTPKIPVSRVVLANETASPCEQWTRDYNHLLAEGAPARALLGLPDKGGCRLVVSADIDHGKSWMMPVAAAHLALAAGHQPADRIVGAKALIWTTGAIGLAHAERLDEARIVEDDYHLKSKAMRSRELFAEAQHAGTPVLCLLPSPAGEPSRDAAEAATWLAAILKNQPHHIRMVATLGDLQAALDTFMKRGRIEDLDAPAPGAGRDLAPLATKPAADDPPPAAAPAESALAQTTAPDALNARGEAAAPASRASASANAASRANAAERRPVSVPLALAAAALGVLVVGAGAFVWTRPPSAPVQQAASLTPQPARPPAPAPAPAAGTATPPAAASPVTPAAVQPAAAPAAPPVTGAVARLVLLTAPPGRDCRSLVMDMQPRFEESVQMIEVGQGPIDIDASSVCGLAVAGHEQVTAAFSPAARGLAIASLSSGSRWILNPLATGGERRIPIDLGGAQSGQIILQLR